MFKLPFHLFIIALSFSFIETVLGDECQNFLHAKTKKTLVRFYDSTDQSDPVENKQADIWKEIKHYFNDYKTIAYFQVDCNACKHVCYNFPNETLPSYVILSENALLASCNRPTCFEEVRNFIFDFSEKSYRKGKGFSVYSHHQCNIIYPTILGEAIFNINFNQKIANGHAFVMFIAPKCRYCKQLIGVWNEAVIIFKDKIKLYFMDCYSFKEFCVTQKAIGYPTLYYYVDGNQKEEYLGNESVQELTQFLNTFLNETV